MRITKPAEIVEVCDFCQRSDLLATCHVCGREFCLSCRGHVIASWGFIVLCRECAEREDVFQVCNCYAEQLTPIFRERIAALKRLGQAKG